MKLTRSQLEQLINGTHLSENGKDLYGTCPQCNQQEFGISLVENNHPFSCFRKAKCGFSGNIYTLLKYLNVLKEYIGEKTFDPDENIPDLIDQVEIKVLEPLPTMTPPVGWRRVDSDQYLEQRGFTPQQFAKHQVGRSVLKRDYVTFLVEMNHRIVGYVSRSTKSKQWIDDYNQRTGAHYLRYTNSTSDFSRMLYGYDELNNTTDVILVEGILSKTKTDTNLDLDSDDWIKCVATFGAKVSEYQIQLLKDKGIKTVWLWFEADVLSKIKMIAARLAIYFEVRVCVLDGFDPGDINSEQAIDLLQNSITFIDIDQNYL